MDNTGISTGATREQRLQEDPRDTAPRRPAIMPFPRNSLSLQRESAAERSDNPVKPAKSCLWPV